MGDQHRFRDTDNSRFLDRLTILLLLAMLVMSIAGIIFLNQLIDMRDETIEALQSKNDLLSDQFDNERELTIEYWNEWAKEHTKNKFICGLCNTPEECSKK